MRVVISQSMYFPWVGFLEQLRLAELFVRYDDVQFSKGFTNRVQIKTALGSRWLTVPLHKHHRGQRIDELQIDNSWDWRSQHLDILRQAYLNAPYREDMLALVTNVFKQPAQSLSAVSNASTVALLNYFEVNPGLSWRDSSTLACDGRSSQRLLDIVTAVGGSTYITGHGARHYLDHELFDRADVGVQYMKYECVPYPQVNGDFTPYVSALDLVANCGRQGAGYIRSGTVNWKVFLHESE